MDYIKKEKNQYVPRLTEKNMSLYSSEPMNIWICGQGGGQYITRLHVIEKYITLYSSVTRNRGI
jgi:hypothetical protein